MGQASFFVSVTLVRETQLQLFLLYFYMCRTTLFQQA